MDRKGRWLRCLCLVIHWAFPVALAVKNLPAKAGDIETQVQSLGQEDPQEKEMVTHSSIGAWEISMDRGAWWAVVLEVTKSRT